MALTLSTVGAAAAAAGLYTASPDATMAMHFGSGNYDPAVRGGTIAAGDTVMTALAGSPTLAGARSVSGAEIQWAFEDAMLAPEYDYAEVVFVATQGATSTPVYLDSAPNAGAILGTKAANTIRQWVVQVEIATGALTVYETRISVPGATTLTPGVTRYATPAEVDARSQVSAAVRPEDVPAHVDTSGLAPLASPIFTGNPTVPDQATGSNNSRASNTRFVATALAALVNSAPNTLDTLNELADALGDDPNFATTIMTLLGGKVDDSEITGFRNIFVMDRAPLDSEGEDGDVWLEI